MKAKILQLLLLFSSVSLMAQLPNGDEAPDFSLDDLGGVNHNLYDYLDQGYSVVLDFSATWCGPCWNYHQTGTLEDIWDDLGPGGDDNTMVFMIEGDPNTSQPCIYGPTGCTGGSIGDWTAGVGYPILNPPAGEAADVRNDYSIGYWPTLYGISPNGDIREIGQAGSGEWESWVGETFQMWNTTWTVEDTGCESASIDLEPVGGYGDINYQWSHGAVSEDVFDLEEGEYYVTLTDDHSSYEVILGPIEVESNNIFEIELADYENVYCFGDESGSIIVDVDGGSGDFEYNWSNGDDSSELYDLPAGDYDLTVTDMDSGCEHDASYTIEEPDPLEPYFDLVDADCGETNGMILFDIEGGEYPYTYYFENFETLEEEVELAPGEYWVTVVDSYGCSLEIDPFYINSTNGPEADTELVGAFNCSSNPVYVNADSSEVGTNIEYYWFDPSYVLVDTGFQVQVDSVGIYTLEVHDLNTDCVTSESVMVVDDFTTPTASANALSVIDCDNPSAQVSASGSTADTTVTYMWTTPDGSILSDPTAFEITAGSAGTYNLQVTNIHTSCSSSAATTLQAPDIPTISLSGANAFCDGGSTTLCVTPGANEAVEWYVGGTYMSNSSCLDVSQSADVTIQLINTDNGCETTESVSVSALAAPSASISGDLEICANDGGATLCVSDNASESVTWMVNGQAVNGTCVDYNLSSDVTVTVVNNMTGCSDSQSVSTVVNGIPSLSIDPAAMLDCNNQSTTLNLNVGGGSGHSVQWVNASGTALSNQEDISVSSAGVYTAIVTTTAGCTTEASVEVQADLNDLADADFQSSATDYSFDFSDASTGDVNSYSWDFGDGSTSTDANPSHTYTEAGYYTVCLSVTNDCGTSTECYEVLAYTTLQISSTVVNVTCNGAGDGQINVNTIGGLAGFEYEWSGPVQGLSGSDVGDLSPGTYTVIVTDATGAMNTQEYTIIEPEVLTVDGNVTNSPAGTDSGSISLDINGGNGNYTVTWSNGATGMMIDNLERGDYTATVVDDLGCEEEISFSVTGTTNVDQIDIITKFTVVPNPASEYIDVQINTQVDKTMQLSVVNLAGQEFYSERTQGSNVSTRIDLSNFAGGIYLVKVNNGDKVSLRKLVVVK